MPQCSICLATGPSPEFRRMRNTRQLLRSGPVEVEVSVYRCADRAACEKRVKRQAARAAEEVRK